MSIADIAGQISAAMGGPYHAATLLFPGTPVRDTGGSIVTPGTPTSAPCQVQVDVATEAMRTADGFSDGDVRLLILSDTAPTTDARVQIDAGPYAGSVWMLSGLVRDPLAVGWEARGRRG